VLPKIDDHFEFGKKLEAKSVRHQGSYLSFQVVNNSRGNLAKGSKISGQGKKKDVIQKEKGLSHKA